MADGEAPALRKRQQIQKAGKNMFVWVAGAAAILGLCAVLATSLYERIVYSQKVIDAKNQTVDTLKKNIDVASSLKKSIRVLNTNQALIDTPRLDGTEPISVILDALPSGPNSSALGASLQQKLLTLDGISVESLTVDPIAGVEDVNDGTAAASTSTTSTENEITFQFTVTATAGQGGTLQQMLRNLERSIRTIDLTSVTIEQQGGKITLTAKGRAYYQPGTTVKLKEKVVPKQ